MLRELTESWKLYLSSCMSCSSSCTLFKDTWLLGVWMSWVSRQCADFTYKPILEAGGDCPKIYVFDCLSSLSLSPFLPFVFYLSFSLHSCPPHIFPLFFFLRSPILYSHSSVVFSFFPLRTRRFREEREKADGSSMFFHAHFCFINGKFKRSPANSVFLPPAAEPKRHI